MPSAKRSAGDNNVRALSGTSVAILIGIVAVGTFALRAMFLQFHDRLSLPAWVKSSLVWVPAAVLAALIAPSFVPTTGGDPARLVAGALAAVVAWRTKNLFATLAAGMIVLWIVEASVV